MVEGTWWLDHCLMKLSHLHFLIRVLKIKVAPIMYHIIKLFLEIIDLFFLYVQLLSLREDNVVLFLNLFKSIRRLVVNDFQFVLVILIYLILKSKNIRSIYRSVSG